MLRVDDHAPGTPPPSGEGGDYRDGGGRPYRTDLRPIEITQPEGPSYVLDGRRLQWQGWDLRIGFHPREGLVLHDIGYVDAGERRSICHRASIAELVIPYGDPNPTVHFKNVFDTGEYGMGPLTNSLELGCDCLGEVAYLDGVTNTGRASRASSATRSASTRRTRTCCGSTPTTTRAASTGPARGGW